ncbi:MAG: flagellar basal body protein [Clostridia bacterium]|nr:flagellar basal body protein [Clostridia bacterium]
MIRSTFYGFQTALSGLKASQTALDVVGQNVSNTNTTGYTRQRVVQKSVAVNNSAEKYGSKTSPITGQGTKIGSLEQIRDVTLDTQFRNENASVGYYDAELGAMGAIESIFDEATTSGMRDSILGIQTAFENLSLNTGSDEYDALVRSSAESTSKLLNQYSRQLRDAYDAEVYEFINGSVADANELLNNLAVINGTIKSAEVSGGNPLELYDQRNNMLDELSAYFDIEYNLEQQRMSPDIATNVLHVYMKDAAGGLIELIDGEQYAQFGVETVESTTYFPLNTTGGDAVQDAEGNQIYTYKDTNDEYHYGTISGDSIQVFKEIEGFNPAGMKPDYENGVSSSSDANSLRDNYVKLSVSTLTKSEAMSYEDILEEAKEKVTVKIEGASRYSAVLNSNGVEMTDSDGNKIYARDNADGSHSYGTIKATNSGTTLFTEIPGFDATDTSLSGTDVISGAEKLQVTQVDDLDGNPLTYIDDEGKVQKVFTVTTTSGKTMYGKVSKIAGSNAYGFEEVSPDDLTTVHGLDLSEANTTTEVYREFVSGKSPVDITPVYGRDVETGKNYYSPTAVTNGIFKGSLDMLNCGGDFEAGGSTIRGFKYYAGALDTLASQMATQMNEQNRGQIYDKDGNALTLGKVTNVYNRDDGQVATDLFFDDASGQPGRIETDRLGNRIFTPLTDVEMDEYVLPNGGLADLETEPYYDENPLLTTNEGGLKGITAGNIAVSSEWQQGKVKVVNSTAFCYKGDNIDGDNSNTLKFIKLFEQDTDFNTTSGITLFTGGYENFLSAIGDQSALDVKTENTTFTSHDTVLKTVDNNRMSVSGVSIDEEAVDIYRFQRAYQASSRVMTTLDECLDKLINGTGRVGL